MTPKWFSKRPPRVDPDEVMKQAEESLEKTHRQQDHVNALTSYLERRKGQNGFGEDFNITILVPRSAK